MKLGIITGMAFEAEILHDAARKLPAAARPVIVCHGFGRSAAHRSAREAIENGAGALLSFGIAGGLDEELEAGAIIIATAVREHAHIIPCDEAWSSRLATRIPNTRRMPLAHSAVVAASPLEKQKLRTMTGAAAVDMESFGIAEIAQELGLPFAALRVVADTADDSLPGVAIAATTPEGQVQVMRSVLGALTHPQQIPALIKLGRRTKSAKAILAELARLGLTNAGGLAGRSFFVQ